ncbi:MAG TPA: hypothetical protein DEO84_03485, partial [candidate division Zixibacteria bacterium]|nr:hypothetical protein [candidate division Zixibacteria bacterium]
MGAAAGIDGSYIILNVPPGTYDLCAYTVGYNKGTIKNVPVIADSTSTVNFTLTSSVLEIKPIIVTAPMKTIDRYLTTNNASKTGDQIRTMPAANLGQLLQSTPGFVKEGGLLHSRGGRQGEISYLVDGNEIKDPLGGNSPNIRALSDRFNTENYDRIYENEFLDVTANPLSTFSIDVDAASYSNIRRFINDGRLPPPDAVRIEEMINYFAYDYPQPRRNQPFSINAEVSDCPWNELHKLVVIGLQGKDIDTKNLPASNLVFLIDVSGSMACPNKLPLLKNAFFLLVDK